MFEGKGGGKVGLSYNTLDNNHVTNMRIWSPYQVVIYVKKERKNLSESQKIKGSEISEILQVCADVDREVRLSCCALLSRQTSAIILVFFVIDLFQGT